LGKGQLRNDWKQVQMHNIYNEAAAVARSRTHTHTHTHTLSLSCSAILLFNAEA
jgi:hypothetical protein